MRRKGIPKRNTVTTRHKRVRKGGCNWLGRGWVRRKRNAWRSSKLKLRTAWIRSSFPISHRRPRLPPLYYLRSTICRPVIYCRSSLLGIGESRGAGGWSLSVGLRRGPQRLGIGRAMSTGRAWLIPFCIPKPLVPLQLPIVYSDTYKRTRFRRFW